MAANQPETPDARRAALVQELRRAIDRVKFAGEKATFQIHADNLREWEDLFDALDAVDMWLADRDAEDGFTIEEY